MPTDGQGTPLHIITCAIIVTDVGAAAANESSTPGRAETVRRRREEGTLSEQPDWDAAYRSGATPWELGQPSPPLVDIVTAYRARLGHALVPGCGRGDDALYIASLGVDVSGWDSAPTAIAAARERARAQGLAADFAVRDALAPDPTAAQTFEAWIEHTFLTALPPEARPRYVAAAATLLRPGGLILGVFFVDETPGGPPFAIAEAGLRALFAPAFRVVSLALATNSPEPWVGREMAAVLERRDNGGASGEGSG